MALILRNTWHGSTEIAKKEFKHWQPSIALARAYNNLDEKWMSEYSTLRSGERLLEGLRLISNEDAHQEYHSHEHYSSLIATILESRNMITSKGDDYSRTEALQRAVWAGKIYELCVELESPSRENPPTKIPQILNSMSEKALFTVLYLSGIVVILLLLLMYWLN